MELTGQQILTLPVEKVWDALNDPAVLQQCIPGCDSFEATGDHHYKIVMTATVGPIKAKFTGKLLLSDIKPPNAYTLQFEGSGGAAGAGKGVAKVQLDRHEEGTLLQYTVSASVSGRLSQVGARLIDGVAKKMADQFFTRFKETLEPKVEIAEKLGDAPQPQTATKPETMPAGNGLKWAIIAAIALIAAGLAVSLS